MDSKDNCQSIGEKEWFDGLAEIDRLMLEYYNKGDFKLNGLEKLVNLVDKQKDMLNENCLVYKNAKIMIDKLKFKIVLFKSLKCLYNHKNNCKITK